MHNGGGELFANRLPSCISVIGCDKNDPVVMFSEECRSVSSHVSSAGRRINRSRRWVKPALQSWGRVLKEKNSTVTAACSWTHTACRMANQVKVTTNRHLTTTPQLTSLHYTVTGVRTEAQVKYMFSSLSM